MFAYADRSLIKISLTLSYLINFLVLKHVEIGTGSGSSRGSGSGSCCCQNKSQMLSALNCLNITMHWGIQSVQVAGKKFIRLKNRK